MVNTLDCGYVNEMAYTECVYRLIGQSGLGKSTLVNTIFASHLIESKGRLEASESTRQTTEIEAVSHSK